MCSKLLDLRVRESKHLQTEFVPRISHVSNVNWGSRFLQHTRVFSEPWFNWRIPSILVREVLVYEERWQIVETNYFSWFGVSSLLFHKWNQVSGKTLVRYISCCCAVWGFGVPVPAVVAINVRIEFGINAEGMLILDNKTVTHRTKT